MTDQGLTFRAFLRERWGRILTLFIAWTVTAFLVLPLLPAWAAGLVYLFVFGGIGFQLGESTERKRQLYAAVKFDQDLALLLKKQAEELRRDLRSLTGEPAILSKEKEGLN